MEKDILISEKFRMSRCSKLGSGSFGQIYLGEESIKLRGECEDQQQGSRQAGRLTINIQESLRAKNNQLIYQAKVLKTLQGSPGVPQLYWYGIEGEYNVMVVELLGPSLEDLFNFCNRRFSLKTTLMIAEQLLQRLEYVHSKSFIHRDIKPDNFLIGIDKRASLIHSIDFGLAKRYRDPKTNQHIPYRNNKNLTGTARYASVNAHLGIQQGRKDDLEAVGYVLMYFLRGQLPWQGIQAHTKQEKYQKIMERKINTSVENLCRGFPQAFVTYLKYCKNLKFEDRPDYNYLRRIFRDQFLKCGYENDFIFDWCIQDAHPVVSRGDSPGKRILEHRKAIEKEILEKRVLEQHQKYMEKNSRINLQHYLTQSPPQRKTAVMIPKVAARAQKLSIRRGDEEVIDRQISPLKLVEQCPKKRQLMLLRQSQTPSPLRRVSSPGGFQMQIHRTERDKSVDSFNFAQNIDQFSNQAQLFQEEALNYISEGKEATQPSYLDIKGHSALGIADSPLKSSRLGKKENQSMRIDPLIKRYATHVPRETIQDKNKIAYYEALRKREKPYPYRSGSARGAMEFDLTHVSLSHLNKSQMVSEQRIRSGLQSFRTPVKQEKARIFSQNGFKVKSPLKKWRGGTRQFVGLVQTKLIEEENQKEGRCRIF